MSITAAQVAHVAALARLDLDANASARMVTDLSTILQYVNNLGKLDVDAVPPTSHALDPQANVLREDIALAGLPQAVAVAAAPAASDGMFKVPRVVELS